MGLKKKTFDAAGVPIPQRQTLQSPQTASPPQHQTVLVVQQPTLTNSKSTAEVTLNMLNASESDSVDVEGLNFEAPNDVVPT